jgi:hypothetical protein
MRSTTHFTHRLTGIRPTGHQYPVAPWIVLTPRNGAVTVTAMTSPMTIDHYINTLRAAGVNEKLASAHAQELADALQETVATQNDLTAL